jgi:hypothetical protein
MKPEALEKFADVIVDTIKKAMAPVKAHCQSLEQRNAILEQRMKELEARPLLKYSGVWKSGETYSEGRLVTHQGGLWLSTETTSGTPGSPASGFRLIVKRGAA